jgi:hypothetical protein
MRTILTPFLIVLLINAGVFFGGVLLCMISEGKLNRLCGVCWLHRKRLEQMEKGWNVPNGSMGRKV